MVRREAKRPADLGIGLAQPDYLSSAGFQGGIIVWETHVFYARLMRNLDMAKSHHCLIQLLQKVLLPAIATPTAFHS